MKLVDILKEERAEMKARKISQKQANKKKKTPEQKRYRIYSVVFTLITICVCFLVCCRGNNVSYDWNQIIGLSSEMQENLSQYYNISDLYFTNKLNNQDKENLKVKLQGVGIDYDAENSLENGITGDLILTDRELGILLIEFNNSGNGDIEEICDFQIYAVGENFYEKSLVRLNLSTFSLAENLPSVYFTTTSRIEIQSGSLRILRSEVIINALSKEDSEQIVEVLGKNSFEEINEFVNSKLNMYINLMKSALSSDMELFDGGIIYKK